MFCKIFQQDQWSFKIVDNFKYLNLDFFYWFLSTSTCFQARIAINESFLVLCFWFVLLIFFFFLSVEPLSLVLSLHSLITWSDKYPQPTEKLPVQSFHRSWLICHRFLDFGGWLKSQPLWNALCALLCLLLQVFRSVNPSLLFVAYPMWVSIPVGYIPIKKYELLKYDL